MRMIFKIVTLAEWEKAVAAGVFQGSAVDLTDGFIHLSDATQVKETAARYFAGQAGLVLVSFGADDFGPALKWEPSRGGALFPHLYATLNPKLARRVVPLPWDGSAHVFPDPLT
jgi:uncharacterized protein (DUF952 family)